MPRPKMKKNKPSLMDEEVSLWEFIYEMVCKKERFDEVGVDLFERYLRNNELPFSAQEIFDYYTETMEPCLYKADLDAEKILDLYKQLEIEVTPHVEQFLEMRCGAGIRIDKNRCLVQYTIFAAPKNKRRQTTDGIAPKKNREEEKEEEEEDDESEEPIRKKIKTWPSPAKNKSDRSVPNSASKRSSPVIDRESFLEKVSKKMQPPRDKNLQPLPWAVPENVDKVIWKYLRYNFDTVTAENIISGEFWEDLFRNRVMPFKSVGVLTRHFRATLVHKLWEQKMDPSVKMKLLMDLRVPVNRKQRRWLLEEEGIEVTTTGDDLVSSWEGMEKEEREKIVVETPRRELPPRAQSPPKMKINTWIPRPQRSVTSLVDDFENFSCVPSDQNSSSSRTHSVAPSRSQSVLANGNDPDDITALAKKEKRTPFTRADDLFAWRYIAQEMYDQNAQRVTNPNMVQPKGRMFWDDFIRKTNSPKTASNWCSHFRKKMCPTLHEANLSREVKLALYVQLDIPVGEDTLPILENRCNAKINLGSERRVHSWRFLGNCDFREQTEPLVNEDEETDGESSATALQAAFETSASPKERESAEELAGPSSYAPAPHSDQRKRKSEEEDHQKVKRRSLKLADMSTDEIEVIDKLRAPSRSAQKSPPSGKDRSGFLRKSDLPPPKKKTFSPSPSPSPPPPPQPPQRRKAPLRETLEPEENIQWSRDDTIDQISHEGDRTVVSNPLDLKAIDGFFMSTHDLLAAIQTILAEQDDNGLELMNEAVAKAFERKPGEQKCNRESVARHSLSAPIDKIRGHFRHSLSARQKEMIVKTTEFCENQAVFRKRVSAMTDALSTRLSKIKPPAAPWDCEDE